jgi:hypothetical protein
VDVAVSFHVDGSTTTAVTATGATERLVLFPTESRDAVAAIAGVYFNRRFVYKFHNHSLPNKKAPSNDEALTIATLT